LEEQITHTCNVCQCRFTDDEGGIDGYFGILPVHFCPTCFSSMCDMASQFITSEDEDEELNPEHERLIEHLRGLTSVVINNQHGGFGLSYQAQLAYLEGAGIAYTLEDRESRDATQRLGPWIKVNGNPWTERNIARDNPVLVGVVKDLGPAANGPHADLKIVRVPGDVTWQIEEYDGLEWVAERHRTWN